MTVLAFDLVAGGARARARLGLPGRRVGGRGGARRRRRHHHAAGRRPRAAGVTEAVIPERRAGRAADRLLDHRRRQRPRGRAAQAAAGLLRPPTRRSPAASWRRRPARWPSWSAARTTDFAARRGGLGADGAGGDPRRRRRRGAGGQDLQQHGAGRLDARASAKPSPWPRSWASTPERFFEIASKSSGQCWSLTSYCPWPGPVPAAPSNRGYEGGFLDRADAQGPEAGAGGGRQGAARRRRWARRPRRSTRCSTAWAMAGKDFSAVLQLLRGTLGDLSRGDSLGARPLRSA